jgi:hypothetical protein
MKSRLDTILETVQSILSEVVDTPQTKEQLLKAARKAMQRADRRTLQLARQGYGVGENPPEHEFIRQNDAKYYRMKSLVSRLEGMTEAKETPRHPDAVRSDIGNLEKEIDTAYDKSQPHGHLTKQMGVLQDELKRSQEFHGNMQESVLKELYGPAGFRARLTAMQRGEISDFSEFKPFRVVKGPDGEPVMGPDGKPKEELTYSPDKTPDERAKSLQAVGDTMATDLSRRTQGIKDLALTTGRMAQNTRLPIQQRSEIVLPRVSEILRRTKDLPRVERRRTKGLNMVTNRIHALINRQRGIEGID